MARRRCAAARIRAVVEALVRRTNRRGRARAPGPDRRARRRPSCPRPRGRGCLRTAPHGRGREPAAPPREAGGGASSARQASPCRLRLRRLTAQAHGSAEKPHAVSVRRLMTANVAARTVEASHPRQAPRRCHGGPREPPDSSRHRPAKEVSDEGSRLPRSRLTILGPGPGSFHHGLNGHRHERGRRDDLRNRPPHPQG